jgi:hypothetical protein
MFAAMLLQHLFIIQSGLRIRGVCPCDEELHRLVSPVGISPRPYGRAFHRPDPQ